MTKQQESFVNIKNRFKQKFKAKILKERSEYNTIIQQLKLDLDRIKKNYATQMMELNEYKLNMKARI